MNSLPHRLAIIATHPIQYHAPWFRAMAADPRLDVRVFFGYKATATDQAGAGFGVPFEWDVPLLEGYEYRFLTNESKRPSPSIFSGIDVPEIGDFLSRDQFDAVLVNGWQSKYYWQAILACWRNRVPVLVRGDSHLHTPRSAIKTALKWIPYRTMIPRFDACLAVGKWSREYFEHYGAKKDRVFFVPHVVDEKRLRSACARFEPERESIRRRLGIDGDSLTFLYAGKLIGEKRTFDFIRAIQRAVTAGAKVQALIVGDGPLRGACEQVAAEGPATVRFAGFLNQGEIAQAYVASDVLVLPSESETWGVVVNEAMHCGRACMVSDVVGCGPDLITADTGMVFPVGDIDRLTQQIAFLANLPDRVRKMGNAARNRMREYSLKAAVEGVVAAVERVRIS